MKNLKFLFAIIFAATLFTACNNDDPIGQEPQELTFENGIFVSCEGGFGSNNASIQFIDINTATIYSNIYSTANNESAGDVLQSILFEDDQAYLVLNGSGKITVVKQKDFVKTGEITGLSSPRYLEIEGNKGYVTNLYSPYIQVINMDTNTVTDSIDLGEQSDQFISEDDKLWVLSPKAWQGRDKNHLYTVDLTDNSVDSLAVGWNPSQIAFDSSSDILYVYCSGKEVDNGNEGAQIVSVDIQTGTVLNTTDLGFTNQGSNIALDELNDRLLFTQSNAVYAYDLVTSSVGTSAILQLEGITYLYDLTVSPTTSEIFIGDAKDFSSAGEIRIYSPSGQLAIQNPVGVGPNGFYFE